MVIEIELSKRSKHKDKYIALVDDCDSDLAELRWSVEGSKKPYYACKEIDGKHTKIHRIIMERMIHPRKLEKGQLVDHINGNGLDNRRENLRIATHRQNLMNRGKNANNTSGYKGVSWDKERLKWAARIKSDTKYKFLGRFNTELEAHEAYCKASDELHKDFANHG